MNGPAGPHRFDGSDTARGLSDAASFRPRQALVLTVWERVLYVSAMTADPRAWGPTGGSAARRRLTTRLRRRRSVAEEGAEWRSRRTWAEALSVADESNVADAIVELARKQVWLPSSRLQGRAGFGQGWRADLKRSCETPRAVFWFTTISPLAGPPAGTSIRRPGLLEPVAVANANRVSSPCCVVDHLMDIDRDARPPPREASARPCRWRRTAGPVGGRAAAPTPSRRWANRPRGASTRSRHRHRVERPVADADLPASHQPT